MALMCDSVLTSVVTSGGVLEAADEEIKHVPILSVTMNPLLHSAPLSFPLLLPFRFLSSFPFHVPPFLPLLTLPQCRY